MTATALEPSPAAAARLALLPPLPGPTAAHLVARWGDRYGRHHRRCSCGATTPAPGMATAAGADTLVRPCVDYAQLAGQLDLAGRLIRSRTAAARSSWLPAPCLTAAARRARGLALLALFAGPAQDETTGPAAELIGEQDERTAARVVPVVGLDATPAPSSAATDAPTTTTAQDRTPEPVAAISGPDADPLPDGYVRLYWTCGHSAAGPARHGWADHKHPCPECNRYPLDRRCPGVRWAAPRSEPLAAVQPRRCAICGADDARPYMGGLRCDRCSPWAAAGRPDPARPALPRTPPPPPRLETVR